MPPDTMKTLSGYPVRNSPRVLQRSASSNPFSRASWTDGNPDESVFATPPGHIADASETRLEARRRREWMSHYGGEARCAFFLSRAQIVTRTRASGRSSGIKASRSIVRGAGSIALGGGLGKPRRSRWRDQDRPGRACGSSKTLMPWRTRRRRVSVDRNGAVASVNSHQRRCLPLTINALALQLAAWHPLPIRSESAAGVKVQASVTTRAEWQWKNAIRPCRDPRSPMARIDAFASPARPRI